MNLFLAVTDSDWCRFQASQRLKRNFDNGEAYLALNGTGCGSSL